MDSTPLLTVDRDSISLKDALRYLRKTGGFQRFIAEILRQHLLEKELNAREDLKVSEHQVETQIWNFQRQNQLLDPTQFQKWLMSQNLNYKEFKEQVELGIKVEQLKEEVTQGELEDYFKKRKDSLDKVALSRIILEKRDRAQDLRQKLEGDRTQFEALAQEHSIVEDRISGGQMGVLRRGVLPDVLRTELDTASEGDIIGPIEVDNRHCLFRVDKFLDASLENPAIARELKHQLFERWIQEKLSKMNIKLEQS